MRCNFCTNNRGILRSTIHGLRKKGNELILTTKRKIYACKFCYEKILEEWLKWGKSPKGNKNFLKHISKIKGFGDRRSIDAFSVMQTRSEMREKRGIITP